jgi:hypothetical protein
MASSGKLRCVALVITDDSEELSASFIRVTRIGELRTTLAITSKQHTACYQDNFTAFIVKLSINAHAVLNLQARL